jgi:hypothetical protein
MLSDVFARWVPEDYPLGPLEPAENLGIPPDSNPLESSNPSGYENGSNPQNPSALADLADRNGKSGDKQCFDLDFEGDGDAEERAAIQEWDGGRDQ